MIHSILLTKVYNENIFNFRFSNLIFTFTDPNRKGCPCKRKRGRPSEQRQNTGNYSIQHFISRNLILGKNIHNYFELNVEINILEITASAGAAATASSAAGPSAAGGSTRIGKHRKERVLFLFYITSSKNMYLMNNIVIGKNYDS